MWPNSQFPVNLVRFTKKSLMENFTRIIRICMHKLFHEMPNDERLGTLRNQKIWWKILKCLKSNKISKFMLENIEKKL